MQLNTAELFERIAEIRRHVEALDVLLLSLGTNKAQARKVADVRESLNELEAAQLNGEKE